MAVAPKKNAAKQQVYSWEGTDKSGKKVKGEISAGGEAQVNAMLRRQGVKVSRVKKQRGSFGKKITDKDIALFTRQLATMMKSGVPLLQAFDIVAKGHNNPSVTKLLFDIKAEVETGSSLTNAFRKYPLYFDPLFCNLVQAGEQAGILDTLLDRLATYKEKILAVKAKIKSAMFYPTAVIIAAFVITAVIMIFVIPAFKDLFNNFGADLPAPTVFVMNLSDFFVAYWWAIFGSIIGTVVGLIEYHKRSKAFREFLDRISLKMPILGDIFALSANARFARTLATMFGGGVPLVEAMRSVAGATGNIVYERAVLEMRDAVSSGQQLNFSMRQTTLFPDMVVQMVAIGEEAGSLSDMLAKVADFYEEELDNKIGMLTTLIEPLVMALLAGIVGSLVIAMYLPIFKMGSVV